MHAKNEQMTIMILHQNILNIPHSPQITGYLCKNEKSPVRRLTIDMIMLILIKQHKTNGSHRAADCD